MQWSAEVSSLLESIEIYIQNFPDAMFILEREKIMHTNLLGAQLLGLKTKEEVIGKSIWDFSNTSSSYIEVSFQKLKEIEEILKVKNHHIYTWSLLKEDGQETIVNITVVKADKYYVATAVNITVEVEYIEELKVFHNVLDNNKDGVLLLNPEGQIYWTNLALEKLLLRSQLDIVENGVEFFYCEETDTNCFNEIISKVVSEDSWSGELYVMDKCGQQKIVNVNCFTVVNEDGTLERVACIFEDITEKKNNQQLIYNLAYIDSLTGLYNRTYFLHELEKEIVSAARYSEKIILIYFDIDGFKTINDTQGHLIGDEILKLFANTLKDCIRETDIAARIDGDEFAVLLPRVSNSEDAVRITSRLCKRLDAPILINNKEFNISFAAGICVYPDDTQSAEGMLHNADIAMYCAKGNKDANVVRFIDDMKADLDEYFLLSNHLRKAIEKNELELNYQPIVDIDSGKLVTAEVLLRWHHSTMGNISPVKFIPIAEASGAIIDIGEWVLREACKQSVEWMREGYKPVPLAVNVSVKQLEAPDFIDKVKRVINETGICTDYLEIEVTESISIANYEGVIPKLEKIRDLGIKISIDDFGTGYSSLSRLKTMAINKLKIDRIFINDISCSKESEIVSSIISLGKSLDLNLVAEGIENEEQLQFLKTKHCQLGQGFLFSRPVTKEEFVKKLERE